MDRKEIQETTIWALFEKGRSYHHRMNVYTDTDVNHRMYNGNQWEGAKLGEVEPVQINFIKPIVKYKCAVIHANLYAINYSSQNHESEAFQQEAKKICDMLNRYASRVWDTQKMDKKLRMLTKDAAINDEGVLYVNFDQSTMMPVCEVIDKNDIYYGNENDMDIQRQPYILIRKRMPVVNAQELAESYGVSAEQLQALIGDNDTLEEAGEAAKQEVDDRVTIVYKMYKRSGTVHFSIASRFVEIAKDKNLGISRYPVAHFVWEEKKGSARGEGEVRQLIPNQLEVNKTLMRRLLTAKQQAYPKTVADKNKIENPNQLSKVGGIIYTQGQTVDDVRKVVGTLPPAQMSPDVKQIQDELVQVTRDLAGAGDSATGQINPETASGRAILAVQQASQAPMTEQKETCKDFIEDFANIQLEYLIAYSEGGINLEQTVPGPDGEDVYQIVKVPQHVLKQLQAAVKIDITPKSVFDKFAQEQTIENLLLKGLFNPQRLNELEAYVEALDDDAVAPKLKLKGIIKRIRQTQQQIAQIEANSQMMLARGNQFVDGDMQSQQAQIAAIMRQLGQTA